MHHANYFWVNLSTAYMEQCISVTDIAHLLGQLCEIHEIIRKFVHITIRVLLCIFSTVLRHFPKASCAKHLLVTKTSFLRKWASTLALGIFSISETTIIKDSTVSIRYISIDFDRKINRKISIPYFLRYATQDFFSK